MEKFGQWLGIGHTYLFSLSETTGGTDSSLRCPRAVQARNGWGKINRPPAAGRGGDSAARRTYHGQQIRAYCLIDKIVRAVPLFACKSAPL
jgi:hypothetical protein